MSILVKSSAVITGLHKIHSEPKEKEYKSPLGSSIKSVNNISLSFLLDLKNRSASVVRNTLSFLKQACNRSSGNKYVIPREEKSLVLLSYKKVIEPELMFQKDLKEQLQIFDVRFTQDFSEGDSKTRHQMLDCVMAGIYSDAKNEINYLCGKNQKGLPESYLKELGELAKESGVNCKEYKGAQVPTGAGSSPFITFITSPLQKIYPNEVNEPELRRKLTEHISLTADITVEKIAPKDDYVSTVKFKNAVAELNEMWSSIVFRQ